jgi:hypothetical protein
MATSSDQRVTTSTVLWGDVCQAVDPDPGTPYPIYTFGGRKEFVEPYRSPVAPVVEDDLVADDSDYFLVTSGNQRIGV